MPIELHADSVVLLMSDKSEPELAIVIEAQLKRDERKLYTWPAYAAVARARHECPCVLLVITPSAKVAHWASMPIVLGCGTFRALVCGPEQIPKITSAIEAAGDPELAVLSVVAHGEGDVDTAVKIASAAITALKLDDGEKTQQRATYLGLIERSLSQAALEIMKMKLSEMKYPPHAYLNGIAQGQIEGQAGAVLKLITYRGLPFSEEHRQRVLTCRDAEVLDRWLTRTLVIRSIDELFDDRSVDELLA